MSLANALTLAREDHNFAELIRAIPYAEYLGVEMKSDEDSFLFTLPFQEKLVGNPLLPALHGGVIAGFMENSAMLHILINMGQGRLPKTVDFSLDYLRSGKPEETYCQCDVTRQGSRVAHVKISCWQSDKDKPIALARIHFILDDVAQDDTADASPLAS